MDTAITSPPPARAARCFLCDRTPADATADLVDCRGPVRRVKLCDQCFELPEPVFIRRCMQRLRRNAP